MPSLPWNKWMLAENNISYIIYIIIYFYIYQFNNESWLYLIRIINSCGDSTYSQSKGPSSFTGIPVPLDPIWSGDQLFWYSDVSVRWIRILLCIWGMISTKGTHRRYIWSANERFSKYIFVWLVRSRFWCDRLWGILNALHFTRTYNTIEFP